MLIIQENALIVPFLSFFNFLIFSKHFCHFVNYAVIFDVLQVLDLYKNLEQPFEVIITRVLYLKRWKKSNEVIKRTPPLLF